MLAIIISIVSFHLLLTIVFCVRIFSWRSSHSKNTPVLSIIIAAKNEEENLKQLIPKLLDQQYPGFEIIIGLDRCSDQSLELLKDHDSTKLKWVDIQSVPPDWNGKKYALNEAIKLANGEWLVFTDADCVPNSDQWLTTLAKEMKSETEIVLGVSPYKRNGSFLSDFIRYEAFQTFLLYLGMTLLKRPYMAVGRNLAVKKVLFHSLAGYESIKGVVGGDDDLFIQKAKASNISVAMGNGSLVASYPSCGWRSYKNQKLRHFSVSKYYQKSDVILLSLYHISHMSIYLIALLAEKSVFLFVSILFYLFIKLAAYRFVASKVGTGFNYILFPVVDMLYAFMIPFLGVWSKLVKDIKWKN